MSIASIQLRERPRMEALGGIMSNTITAKMQDTAVHFKEGPGGVFVEYVTKTGMAHKYFVPFSVIVVVAYEATKAEAKK